MAEHVELELLERYLDGELRSGQRRLVQRHLQECDLCRKELEALERQGALLRRMLEQKAAEQDFSALHERVMQQIRAQRPLPWGERWRLWARNLFLDRRAAVWAFSAALVLLVVGGVWLGLRPLPGPELSLPAAAVASSEVRPPAIIDSLEYAGQRSLVYTVSRNNTMVIWLVDFDQAARSSAQGDDL